MFISKAAGISCSKPVVKNETINTVQADYCQCQMVCPVYQRWSCISRMVRLQNYNTFDVALITIYMCSCVYTYTFSLGRDSLISAPRSGLQRTLLSKEGRKGGSSVEKGHRRVLHFCFPIHSTQSLYPSAKKVPRKINKFYHQNMTNISLINYEFQNSMSMSSFKYLN